MGKTNPTYRDRVTALEDNLDPFKRALRRQHKPAFSDLMCYAKDFADAGGHLNPTDVRSTVLLSICLAQQVEIRELKQTVEELTDENRSSRSGENSAELNQFVE